MPELQARDFHREVVSYSEFKVPGQAANIPGDPGSSARRFAAKDRAHLQAAVGGMGRISAQPCLVTVRLYTETVSTLEQPGEPELRIYPREEAPPACSAAAQRKDLVVDDVPDGEWAAFQAALAET